MVLTISTNTAALNVQRNLNEANEASASSLAKLSSGSRVPTAKDDAASLAIGSRVEAEIAGLKQASTNASQATSLLQIADGAYGEINDILIRQESLAIQSASGQLSDTERAIIDSEFQQLNDEVDRIAVDTEFNGNQLLNGGSVTTRAAEISSGSLAADGISVALDSDLTEENSIYEITYASNELTLTNKSTGEVVKQDIEAALDAAAGTGNNLTGNNTLDVEFGGSGVTITLDSNFDRAGTITSDNAANDVSATSVSGGALALGTGATASLVRAPLDDAAFSGTTLNLALTDTTITGTAGSTLKISNDGGTTSQALDGTASMTLAQSTTYTILDENDNTVATFTTDTSGNGFAGAGASTAGTISFDFSGNNSSFVAADTTESAANFSFKVGTGTQAQDDIAISVDAVTTQALGTSAASVDTQANANAAIDTVKTAIDNLQGSRANIGASLSRLDFASSNLSVAIENQSAAKSGLMDVDMASETTNYAAQQVIVQAGVSLLAQANQRPSQLTSLIG